MLNFLTKSKQLIQKVNKIQTRTFLSPAYYCKEAWTNRLNSPILQKVNLNDLYQELDQRFQKTRQISAVDVDIFANAIQDDVFIDELFDLIHKLRLSAETGNTLNSTSHAVIRSVLDNSGKLDELINALDDRLNYGLFLDDFTANILLDTFWKSKNYVQGSRVASQLMLQEDLHHPISINLSLVHCFSYLLEPSEWIESPKPEEPEEEIKVRVKYIRNPYNDEHFDLREPLKIIGKTLAMATNNKNDKLNKSLQILGLVLYNKPERAMELIKQDKEIYKCTYDLLPENCEIKSNLTVYKETDQKVLDLLKRQVVESINKTSEKDITNQCELYSKWENERFEALKEQEKRLTNARRLQEIEEIKRSLKEKETKLWFFENEEQIELGIEEKLEFNLSQTDANKGKKGVEEEEYVPPEVRAGKPN